MKIKKKTFVITLILCLISSFLPTLFAINNSILNKEQVELNDSIILKNDKLSNDVYSSSTQPAAGKSIFDYLSEVGEDVLEITLTTDLHNLVINKNSEEYQMANLKATNDKKEFFDYNLEVKPRGKFRRKVCDFPPLKLNFSKKELEKEGFVGEYDKLKLVTHCMNERLASKENVLREYLTYKMYNELTSNSFRVQLVKIRYVDLHNSMKPVTRFGFLIEDTGEMAARLNGEICDCHGMKSDMVAHAQSNFMAMFQYMIGNEDWSIPALRNIKAVNAYTGQENIVVPYDFDFSGMVDAPYAIPDPDLGHRTVQERHFFGNFSSELEYQKMADYFLSKRKDLERIIKQFKALSPIARGECLIYLEEFFLVLENENLSRVDFKY